MLILKEKLAYVSNWLNNVYQLILLNNDNNNNADLVIIETYPILLIINNEIRLGNVFLANHN